MSTHIDAVKNDISPLVIVCGDPIRAKYIAEKYLKDTKVVNRTRLELAYTGYYNDKLITVMATGMGMPSIAIYLTELFEEYDVQKVIRVGSCGSLHKEIGLNEIILVEKAYTLSNFAYQYNGSSINVITASKTLNEKITKEAENQHKKILIGNINTSDLFYKQYKDENIEKNYCLGVEMECFALFYIAKLYQKESSCILTVSDNVITQEKLSSLERTNTFDDAIVLALESI